MLPSLENIALFRGIAPGDAEALLPCLKAYQKHFQKGETVLPEGAASTLMGVVLAGRAIIALGDVWGNSSVVRQRRRGADLCRSVCMHPGRADAGQRGRRRGYDRAVFERARAAASLRKPLRAPYDTAAQSADGVCRQKCAAFPPYSAHHPQKASAGGCCPIFPSAANAAAAAPSPSPTIANSWRIISGWIAAR